MIVLKYSYLIGPTSERDSNFFLIYILILQIVIFVDVLRSSILVDAT